MASQTALYKQKNEEMTDLIRELTKVEEELTMKLAYANNRNVRRNIEKSIRIVSETKENLVSALGSLSTYYTSNLENSSHTLEQQTEAVGIIDREMQIAKKRLQYVNKQKANKLRKVEINQYYAASYREKTLLLKWFLVLLVVFVIYYYVKKIFEESVPPLVFALILTGIVVYFGYNMLQIILSINARSNMVYDEYDFKFDKDNAPEWDPEKTGTNPFRLRVATCVAQACCSEGTLYSNDLGVCLPEVSPITGKCSPAAVNNKS